MNVTSTLGRMMFGGFFLYNGINHFKNSEGMAPYAGSKGVPKPDLMVKATGVALVAGGASVLLGIKPKWGALAIVGFLAGVSPIMHNFWRNQDPGQRQNDIIHFAKNVALLGAALELTGSHHQSEQKHSPKPTEWKHDWRSVGEKAAA